MRGVVGARQRLVGHLVAAEHGAIERHERVSGPQLARSLPLTHPEHEVVVGCRFDHAAIVERYLEQAVPPDQAGRVEEGYRHAPVLPDRVAPEHLAVCMPFGHLGQGRRRTIYQRDARVLAEAPCVRGLAERHDHRVVGYPQVLHRARQDEAVRRDDACVAVVLDEAAHVEVLGVDDGVEGVDEDAPLGRCPEVVAEAREPVADHALAHEPVLERLDHASLEGFLPDPPVGLDAHAGVYQRLLRAPAGAGPARLGAGPKPLGKGPRGRGRSR